MSYSQDFRIAARRYLKTAQILDERNGPGELPGCKAVAGYLFGIAGELAVKEMLRTSGIKPLPPDKRHDDPFFAHFPGLKVLLTTAWGRRAGELRTLSEDPRLFQNWDIAMRYAPTAEIDATRVAAWRTSAEKLVGRMEME